MTDDIILYEELTMNAHPAIKTLFYDGWVMRFSNGYTGRANSVYPLYLSNIPIEEKIIVCEESYRAQNLPAMFKITESSPSSLDKILKKKGYQIIAPTNIMITELTGTANHPDSKVIITNEIDKAWQENHFRISEIHDRKIVQTACIMQDNIQNKVICAMIEVKGTLIATGFCVIERNYAGLYGIVVERSERGKGYGYDLCSSLLNRAMEEGATTAYLQVIQDNIPAIALYQKLGFENLYPYWYRVETI